VRYLHASSVKSVSVVGASMGGSAAAAASILAEPGEIERVVLLAAAASGPPAKLKGRTLFIVSRDDTRGDGVARLPRIREQYEQAPQPKQLVILEGSAHAQHLFATEQGPALMHEILRFLTAP
jgi:pimeloyl-ACP methyl ester carboxylesterase